MEKSTSYAMKIVPTVAPAPINVCVNPSEETIQLGSVAVRFLITAENSNGSVAAFELGVPAAQRLAAPAHSHDHYEETIYGIDGVLTWTVNGNQINVVPGEALCIPRGAVHRFDNFGSRDVRALCVISPAAIGPQYFREFRRSDQRGSRWPAESGEDDGDHAAPRSYPGIAASLARAKHLEKLVSRATSAGCFSLVKTARRGTGQRQGEATRARWRFSSAGIGDSECFTSKLIF